ncbi:MAG TPA: hypothetical protein VMZ30_18410 [Pyrinomonadaceae bacterium]|nr:hypothetical protein [Pyrinomonadaceae bacterium]
MSAAFGFSGYNQIQPIVADALKEYLTQRSYAKDAVLPITLLSAIPSTVATVTAKRSIGFG